MTRKEYPITQEIEDLFTEAQVSKDMRDGVICGPFGWFQQTRAEKYARQYINLSRRAWRMVAEIHPETREASMQWNAHGELCVYESDKQ